jgi:transcriptional regulator with XRE-family HTH domain
MSDKKSVGNKAVGAYLRRLRELHGLSRTKVAAAMDTNENQIKRIEDAVGSTSGLTLLKLIRFLSGSAEQVADLVVKENVSTEDGRQLAEEWFHHGVACHTSRNGGDTKER